MFSYIFPKANPDFEDKFSHVSTWYIEFDEENNYPNREIGFDNNKIPIVKAPYKDNIGFWLDTDLTFEDFEKFGIELISKERFEEKW